MGIGKPHIEFMKLDMDEGWETPLGYPSGMQQKVLTSDLDEEGNTIIDETHNPIVVTETTDPETGDSSRVETETTQDNDGNIIIDDTSIPIIVTETTDPETGDILRVENPTKHDEDGNIIIDNEKESTIIPILKNINRDCTLSEWGEWSNCSATCGGGNQIRTKDIIIPSFGNGTCY